MKENKIEFLRSLEHLPVIKKEIMEYGQLIIQKAKSKKEEELLVEEIIEKIVDDMSSNNILTNQENIDLIKGTLRALLLSQIPLSKIVKKLRDQISNRPKIFE